MTCNVENRRILETGEMRFDYVFIAVRGERLALSRMNIGTADTSPGAPHDEFLQLYGIDDEGRVALQIWFDLEDMDAAIAELDALHARFEEEGTPSAASGKHGGARIRSSLVALRGRRLGCRG